MIERPTVQCTWIDTHIMIHADSQQHCRSLCFLKLISKLIKSNERIYKKKALKINRLAVAHEGATIFVNATAVVAV